MEINTDKMFSALCYFSEYINTIAEHNPERRIHLMRKMKEVFSEMINEMLDASIKVVKVKHEFCVKDYEEYNAEALTSFVFERFLHDTFRKVFADKLKFNDDTFELEFYLFEKEKI
jgi:hypothetical protein